MILNNNNKLKGSLLINKYQTGGKGKFDPYAGLYATRSERASTTNQVPQNIRNLQEEEDKKANEIIRVKEAKEKEARRKREIEEEIRIRRENPDMMTGISDAEAKKLSEKSERLENPTIGDRLEQLGKAPARYITNPLRALGDFDYAMHGNTQLPNTVKERETDIKSKLYNAPGEKKRLEDLKKEELKSISIDAAIEAGTLGAGKLGSLLYKGGKKVLRAKNIKNIGIKQRMNHLQDLKDKRLIHPDTDLPYFAKSNELTSNLTKESIDARNTYYRGVKTNTPN